MGEEEKLKESLTSQKAKIAVIGAGICGMLSIAALREEGFEPICYEASDRPGGLWNYREESIDGFGSLMPTTTINHSKEMGAFSNFPPKKEYSNHMPHKQFFQYYMDYYKHNDCEKYVQFNTEVVNVKKNEDYDETGRLLVTVRDRISDMVSSDVFDGVMVATGHFTYPKMPNFPGLETFKGEVIHTHSLKGVDKYRDQNVLVIGAGCSALDAAECTSFVAKQVYLSTRSGMVVVNRVGPRGFPIDYTLNRRYLECFLDILPANLCSWYAETFYLDPKFDRNLYYVKPKYRLLSKDPALNETIAAKLLSGVVIQKGAVSHFTENGVVFEGEETVTEIDSVVMGTGYLFKFPFLDDELLQIEANGQINLYKCVYPTHLPHPSLAFIGFHNPFGAGFPIDEIQCRWVTQVFAGRKKLPRSKKMLKDVLKRHRNNERRFAPNEHMSIRIDYVSYLDDVSSLMGCKPNLLKYFFTDIPLFSRLIFGASVPYQYRLRGPHKWEGARKAIMTVEDRVVWPLSREKRRKKGFFQSLATYVGNIIPKYIYTD